MLPVPPLPRLRAWFATPVSAYCSVVGQILLTVLVRDSPVCLPVWLNVSSVTAPTCRPKESRLLHLPCQSGETLGATGAIHLRCSDSEQSVSKRARRTNGAARTGHPSRGTSFMRPYNGLTGGRDIEQGNICEIALYRGSRLLQTQ